MKITRKTTLSEFLYLTSVLGNAADITEKTLEKAKSVKLQTIKGKTVPKSLNHLNWGQLSHMLNCKTTNELIFVSFEVVLDIKTKELLLCPAFDVFAFLCFIQKELERIGKLFEKIKYNPSSEEIQAGINNLNFGLFGTLDWWAKRMRITDHAEAEKTPWVRIYECMKNDNQTAKFQQRLTNILIKKKK